MRSWLGSPLREASGSSWSRDGCIFVGLRYIVRVDMSESVRGKGVGTIGGLGRKGSAERCAIAVLGEASARGKIFVSLVMPITMIIINTGLYYSGLATVHVDCHTLSAWTGLAGVLYGGPGDAIT